MFMAPCKAGNVLSQNHFGSRSINLCLHHILIPCFTHAWNAFFCTFDMWLHCELMPGLHAKFHRGEVTSDEWLRQYMKPYICIVNGYWMNQQISWKCMYGLGVTLYMQTILTSILDLGYAYVQSLFHDDTCMVLFLFAVLQFFLL